MPGVQRVKRRLGCCFGGGGEEREVPCWGRPAASAGGECQRRWLDGR